MSDTKEASGLKLGPHQFRKFSGADMAFGADGRDYPSREMIPAVFHSGNTPYNKAFCGLFFRGGRLSDYGLSWKDGIDQKEAMVTIRALMSSFAPKHEIKEATVAWAFSEWCDYAPPKSA